MDAKQILDRQFLEMRARILELAASLDRLDRANGDVADERQMVGVLKGIEILNDGDADRANRVQLLFSREYDENWSKEFQVESRF